MNLKKLNGWQRIWLVCSIIYVWFTAVFFLNHFPTERKHLDFWASSIVLDVEFHRQSEAGSAFIKKIRNQLGDEGVRSFV
jgi:hypothetical protein